LSLATKVAKNTKRTKAFFQKCVQAFPRIAFVHLVIFISFVFQACRPEPSGPQAIVAVTRPVGSWQGRGTATVGDVPSETGRVRLPWATANESPAGTGTFKLTMRSAISGRTLGIVADHKGVGSGTSEFDEGPRTYDFLVESANVDWSFRVEETSGEFSNASPRAGAAQGQAFVPGPR
jgi:hypothetical protein